MKRRTLISSVMLLSFLGLADAAYLATAAMTGTPLTCNVAGLSGCNLVAQSPYSHVFGVPLGVYGVVFYALVLLVAFLLEKRTMPGLERWLAVLAGAGLVASGWFLYIQFALIKALCIYCLGSAGIAFLLCVPVALLLGPRKTELTATSA